jgi:hypothetical protein
VSPRGRQRGSLRSLSDLLPAEEELEVLEPATTLLPAGLPRGGLSRPDGGALGRGHLPRPVRWHVRE